MSQLWPADFRATAEEAFGGSLNRTAFGMVNRRVEHAFEVWRRRYAMNPKQEDYAWEILAWAISKTSADVQKRLLTDEVKHPYMYLRQAVASGMERVVNDERVHAGFKRRAELVDVRAVLQTL